MTEHSSRTVVITGGGTGIGRATAHAFAEAGDCVIVVGRRSKPLEAVAAEHTGIIAMTADVTDPEQLRRVSADVVRLYGSVDVLVANAGGSDRSSVDTLEDVAAHWHRSLDSNLMSAVLLEHAFRPHLRRPGGRLVAVSSQTATSAGGSVAYASAKAAVNRWIVQVASDLGPDGITANVVSPGFVPDTGLYGGPVDSGVRDKLSAGTAVRRPGTPEDIAGAIRYLASPEAAFVSGAVLDIDGGRRVYSV